ncbi:uncharacterized protein LOC125525683 [Triticum urartu]|uniref:uncharacterized protein LOC125525683 n=1 Tax=Triticum urartu TaxID=4572 RepID=UPI002044A2DB|nr:uncharacterized protein LOC125525683 [Triticum urartu]XP_048546642.1 uncharacterized protein LOC125525683 [Triticum urartu]
MSKQSTELGLDVKDFDDVVKQLIDLLRGSDGTVEGQTKAFALRRCVFEDLGLTAVLTSIAKVLKSEVCDDSETRKHFTRIVHADCSSWKNRRTLQRVIVEELNLHHVMHIIDKQDEEDDFKGVDSSSREEIASIKSMINECLRNERFLIIFNYGGVEDIDLVQFGIPLFGKGKLLWTNGKRFEAIESDKVKLMPTCVNIYISIDDTEDINENQKTMIHRVLHEDAVGVIGDIGMDGINPEIVLDCFLYTLFLTAQIPENSTDVDYGWATHACNYWICDGILGEENSWEIGNALYGLIPRLANSTDHDAMLVKSFYLGERKKSYKGWHSVTSSKLRAKDISNVPGSASSYFLTCQGDGPVHVRNDLFQVASGSLRVLKLCNCSFDFASPSFGCCHNLRFLWLDRCANTGRKKEQSGWQSFSNLLVFDLHFTAYGLWPQIIESMANLRELNTKGISWKTMSHSWKKLQKLHKLRVTRSSDVVTVDSCSFVDMMNLELLDLSGNTHMESLPTLSSAKTLKMLSLDGCSNLEHVALAMEAAPPLLESFSFDAYCPAENWAHPVHLPQEDMRLKAHIAPIKTAKVTKISLHGCGRLQNIFLRGLPNLEELDLSGTAIKSLDLHFTIIDFPKLKKLFLLGCEHLRCLRWKWCQRLEVLHVDTHGEKRSMICCEGQRSFGFQACIAFSDGRFIWSALDGIYTRLGGHFKFYLLISCTSHSQANITRSIQGIGSSQEDNLVATRSLLPYDDIPLAEDVTCLSLVWYCRQVQTFDLHIEIGEGSYNLGSMEGSENFRAFALHVQSLHVHDNSSITAFPGVHWSRLEWCHVERCPRLHSLFSSRGGYGMKTFSASNLLVAYCIWPSATYHQQLQHIYLYNCPRLVFAFPICCTLPSLETLQIAYCSNLWHVFPTDHEFPEDEEITSGVTFNNLKYIKLHHLHKLEQICEARLTAPALQTVGIRDCWGLRRLPAVAREGSKPVVDCEKDLWDSLEWDGLDAGHDPSLFETHHSAYYKKTLPRGSYLR